nr:hydantoinase B/oxoprolinase family protein [Sphaerospermopsis torques-reginae]
MTPDSYTGNHGGFAPTAVSKKRQNGTEEILGSTATVEMQPGDIFVIETPGGGGFS